MNFHKGPSNSGCRNDENAASNDAPLSKEKKAIHFNKRRTTCSSPAKQMPLQIAANASLICQLTKTVHPANLHRGPEPTRQHCWHTRTTVPCWKSRICPAEGHLWRAAPRCFRRLCRSAAGIVAFESERFELSEDFCLEFL
jgi:hypothetical protein